MKSGLAAHRFLEATAGEYHDPHCEDRDVDMTMRELAKMFEQDGSNTLSGSRGWRSDRVGHQVRFSSTASRLLQIAWFQTIRI